MAVSGLLFCRIVLAEILQAGFKHDARGVEIVERQTGLVRLDLKIEMFGLLQVIQHGDRQFEIGAARRNRRAGSLRSLPDAGFRVAGTGASDLNFQLAWATPNRTPWRSARNP